ncbi:MAG: SusC/RagA family TonB-linked outer membrane protein [Gemmatimonadales bacterium]
MSIVGIRRLCGGFALLALLGATAATNAMAAQGQSGTVSGRVTDQATGQAISGARVVVVGTTLVGATDADGRYTIRNIPPGEVAVRAAMIGYASGTRSLTVAAGETATADVALTLSAYTLDAVVTTATGDQRKREVGNVISTIDAATLVQTAPIANMNDLLVAKAPGVHVLPGNLTGAGARVRIRGTSSLSLNNEPIYIIDGIRMESAVGSSSIGIGGTNPSRLNDINPEEIESIDVVKGPSAAALYGTAAANGVIVIKTKRGRPGPARWNAYAEGGLITDMNRWPIAYRGWRNGSTPTNGTQCILTQLARGECTQDSVTQFNLFEDPDASPNGTGYRQQYGLQVSGGSDAVRYFVSGEWEDEVGQLKMPRFAVDRVRLARNIDPTKFVDIPFEQLRPNGRRRTSVRANVNATLNDKTDVSVSTGFVSSDQRLPQTDNNTTGLLSNGFGGPGNKDNGAFGYRLFTPDEFMAETVRQDINRFIGSGTANWRPTPWLAAKVSGGLDYTNRKDTDLCVRDQCVNFATIKSGFKEDNRTNFFQYTLDGSATATFDVTPTLGSRTTVGVQYFKSLFARNGAFGEDLPPGSTTLSPGAILEADETTAETITLGAFVEQNFSYKSKLYVTGALRVDDNSAFGAEFSAVYYPKLSVSYVISDEAFWPQGGWVNSLRLRGALGASGVQPGTTDALRFFAPTTANIEGTDTPVLVFSAIGNPDLKPERSRELELGLDATMFDSKVNFEFTFYNKRTKDALVAVPLPPSAGTSVDKFDNIGSITNMGVEALLSAQLIQRPSLGWDVTISGSANRNRIADLGDVPPIVGTTIHQREGYPINSAFLRKYSYSDLDNNGLITANEIIADDSVSFIGPQNPTVEISFSNGVDLFNRKLRLTALVDFKGGHYQLNGTERIRCESRLNCRGLVDPTASLEEQARVVALREHPSRSQWGYVEKADFLRFREVSATLQLPETWANAFRVKTMSVTAAARNLGFITGYSGLDPESNYFEGATGIVSDFQTTPPPSYFTFRLNVNF